MKSRERRALRKGPAVKVVNEDNDDDVEMDVSMDENSSEKGKPPNGKANNIEDTTKPSNVSTQYAETMAAAPATMPQVLLNSGTSGYPDHRYHVHQLTVSSAR